MFLMWCGQNFGFTFILGEKSKQDALTVGCKTADIKTKWIEAIRLAQYVLSSQMHRLKLATQRIRYGRKTNEIAKFTILDEK